MEVSTKAIQSFVERLQRDVGGAEPTALIGVFDLEAKRWIVEGGDETEPDDFGDEGWVARIHGSELLLEDFEDVLLLLANFAQDAVMDEIGRSWPDIEFKGRMVHVDLERHDGEVWWAYKGQGVRAVGSLTDT